MSEEHWVVHKFGGSSVASAERYKKVREILEVEPGQNKAIVVSAMGGVTDALIDLLERAKRRDYAHRERLGVLEAKHLETIEALSANGSKKERSALSEIIRADVRDIADVLRAVWLGRDYAEATLELVAGYGELWSAQILAAHLASEGRAVQWLDARTVLTVRKAELGPAIDWDRSRTQLQAWVAAHASPWVVITGYIASTPDGVPTTLKRNGSDFSASIFGALLSASEITIWTDVDGVLSADPRRVPEAVLLDEMSYDEAMELAYFGAKVLHPRTMAPAVADGIPIWIRNTFRPEVRGTRIGPPSARKVAPAAERSLVEPARAVKGFSTVDGVTLINVEGTGMVGVPGIAQRLFGALQAVGVSVVLISQASSEHSICFAVPEAQAEHAQRVVEHAFQSERDQGYIQRVERIGPCSILAAVGDTMADTPGVAAMFFGALGKVGVNVQAIAQGSSERNISAVIDMRDSTRALRAVHAGFYLSNQTISVGVIGPGLVGSELLQQLQAQAAVLRSELKIDLRVRGIMRSERMVLGEPLVDLHEWREALEGPASCPSDIEAFASHIKSGHLPHSVIIDASASEDVAEEYLGWLERGIHVITPNKRAGAGPLDRYQKLRQRGRELRTHFFYEATVGAGLPVISTLRDLIQTGDRITKIEGVLSGTMSHLFSGFVGQTRFSHLVLEAKRLGYTEPDPRDDLSGMDVARKLVILAREMGRPLELSDVEVESLVPEPLRGAMTGDEFLIRLADYDPRIERLRAQADAAGETLRYVGVVGPTGPATVALRRYPRSHPFARVTAGDNIFAFSTSRYRDRPLVVQGPGAGPEVTAGGVFADLVRLAAYLGAPS